MRVLRFLIANFVKLAIISKTSEDNAMKKPLPIGVDNFEKIITNGYYFVDKTWLIKELLDNKSEVNLFTRPRRFGKTLNLSMLRYFFEKSDRDNSHLFQGLKIMETGEKYTSQLGRYPVISLSLKSAKQPSFEMAYNILLSNIEREFIRHSYLLTSERISPANKQDLEALLNRKAPKEIYATSLQLLSQCLYQHHGQKVIILIDEYDVPLENAHFEDKEENRGFYEKMISFIRSLFESALKTNDALEFAVITGCLRITKESIFTGLNNLNVISILADEYSEHFGFTQEEVSVMLTYYELMDKKDLVKKWYDGYMFGDSEVYNPWSVINFVSKLAVNENTLPAPFWSNTSSNSIVKELVERADSVVKQEIEELIAGKTIEKPVREEITYEDVYQSQDNLWNFLFLTGYLKKVSGRLGSDNKRMITLAIPNIEVGLIYDNSICQWFEQKIAQKDLSNLYRSLLEGDVETLTNELNRNLQESISFYDAAEMFYHGFLLGLLKNMAGYITRSNREAGKGRSDILIYTPSVRGKAIILELKVVKNFQELEAACDQALSQVAEKSYEAELRQEGYSNIMKYGIAFFRKDCLVKLAKAC